MLGQPAHRSTSVGPTAVAVFTRVGLMLLPTGLLLLAALRHPGPNALMLWLGIGFQGCVCLLSFLSRRGWRQPVGPTLITLYLIALAWLWWGAAGREDWFTHLTKAILLVVPIVVFAFQTLIESGAPAIRRACVLADRLAARKDWPSELAACRALPEVKALRAALTLDAAPALALLQHLRTEVRVCALAALEFRKDWRPRQAELVLQTAQHAEQPVVRAAAVGALANVDDRPLVEAVAQFLSDPSLEVRRAATESLLWDTERRWGWIRYVVRRVLADPLYQNDGALCHNGELLTPEAVNDLTAWCAEKGVLAVRAALTLGVHYNRALAERPDETLVKELRRQLADPHTPAVLRIELGRLLQYHQELDPPLLEQLLDSANPAPLRLSAAETLLAEHADGPLYGAAVAALRDLARLPNREIALATADVIQRRLGVDLGLGLGQPLPAVHSRPAAEVTRRVMRWAVQHDAPDNSEDSRVTAARA
jgi:HEAT repeat protein